MAAVEAAAHGCTTVLIGGWRERQLGGMMSGGLGFTDFIDIDAFGGRARSTLYAIQDGHAPKNPHAFKPSCALAYFEDVVGRAGVPVYWSKGVEAVERDPASRRLTRLATLDGRRVSGRVFIDASYEGDLLARAGVSFRSGRETADSGDRLNGFRGTARTDGSANNQFALKDREFRIDPFNREGDQSSGLLPGVNAMPRQALGAADACIQAYNFRLTMTNRPELRRDLPASAPDGYRKADFELLFRYIDALQKSGLKHGVDWSFRDDLIRSNDLGDGVFDINANGGFSTDPLGLSWGYPDGGYAERERIWKAHETYTRGFFYALAWDADPRLPKSLQKEARQWGLVRGENAAPGLLDAPGWSPQLYIREARRMEGEVVWTGADLEAPKDQPPRSPDIVAMASYREDSHHVQRLAVTDPDGTWRVWNEGNIEAAIGPDDHLAPLPLAITLPRRDQCTNLFVPFCVSATHQSFSAIRMEMSAMALGQACGAAAALVCASTERPDVQDVPYPALRRMLLRDGAVLAPSESLQTLLRRAEAKGEHGMEKVVSLLQR